MCAAFALVFTPIFTTGHLEMNGTGSRSPSCSPLVRMKRIYGSSGSNSGHDDEQQQEMETAKRTENETEATESDRLATELEGVGSSPSTKSEEGEIAKRITGQQPGAKSKEGDRINRQQV